MKLISKRLIGLLILVIIVLLVAINYKTLAHFFTLDQIKKNNVCLAGYVARNYYFSVIVYMAVFIGTVACGLPLVIPLALIGGFLYGMVLGLLFVTISCVIGSLISFTVLRYVVSDWVRSWHNERVDRFNEQVNKYGYSYLLMLHFLSVIPIFVINLLAAIAKVPLITVLWVTVVGTFPLNFLCVMAGKELGSIRSFNDIFSPTILLLLGIMALIVCVPMLIKKLKGGLRV